MTSGLFAEDVQALASGLPFWGYLLSASVIAAIFAGVGSVLGIYFSNKFKSKAQDHKLKAKDLSIERTGQEFILNRLQMMVTEQQDRLNELQQEHVACREENAAFKRDIANQGKDIDRLTKDNDRQGKEIDNLRKRIQELETAAATGSKEMRKFEGS